MMRNWFRPQPVGVDDPDQVESYREGRVDERRRLERNGVVSANRADIAAAYERGRLREMRVRRGSPLLSFLAFIAIVIAGALIYLAVQNGSFSNGGAIVDRDLGKAAQSVKAPLKGAAERAGDALENAGRALK